MKKNWLPSVTSNLSFQMYTGETVTVFALSLLQSGIVCKGGVKWGGTVALK